jgi:ubiquinone/menaquinone biosynthesis C-methylase UbiE
MITRVLEPEVMDSAEEARDYDAMDHAEVNRVFVADFLAAWDGSGPVLDVGTGTAQIPIELCRQAPAATVTAIDLAAHMLEVARANVRRAGLEDRVRLERADAKGLRFADGAFAALISNSIIHHSPRPERVLAEMVRVVRPGGRVFVRDLMRPDSEALLKEQVARYAGTANPHQQQMFAESLHAALTVEEVRRLVSALHLDPDSVRQSSDRHWTWSARKDPTAPP